ncbi:MAG: hypothetical protein ACD_3C00094G0002 [uncultured bacterium (gcode 4)]|uniref:Uncharacterized protein n=1 Tax=uncultured bacterium (gcode 4) TaxID=1234023 RepID=K2FYY1_9BACT|nr:MAG: hypothetical protein ACD_3C00094G0002 [uncultured bacterium (gcode 4)]
MHKEILSINQLALLRLVKEFSNSFYLVWGTAMSLYIWHRKSIDFDLFSNKPINHNRIISTIKKFWYSVTKTLVKNEDELTVIIDGVKFTFLYFPFDIKWNTNILPWIKSLELLDIAALKAYAIWSRSKWKDYVDMYLITKDYYSISEISDRARLIFGWSFNEKIFREQLCYFDDIDYTEEVDYINDKIEPILIKNRLSEIAVL